MQIHINTHKSMNDTSTNSDAIDFHMVGNRYRIQEDSTGKNTRMHSF